MDQVKVSRQEFDNENTLLGMIIEGEYNSRGLQDSCRSLKISEETRCNQLLQKCIQLAPAESAMVTTKKDVQDEGVKNTRNGGLNLVLKNKLFLPTQ